MNQEEKRIRCLERRMKFLEARTNHGKKKALSYDCSELSALRWAIWKLRSELDIVPEKLSLPIHSEDIR